MRVLGCLLILLLSFNGISQQYNFINYTLKDGLAQSQVRDICQDDQGYLWIGTRGGLSRFNGIEFENYSVDDGLPDNYIRKLFKSKNGYLWIATPSGVAYRDEGKFVSFPFDDEYRINDIEEFRGIVHFASNTGLIAFEDEEFNSLTINDSIGLYFRAMANYNDAVLLCGGKDGLFTWNGTTLEELKIPNTENLSIRDLKIQGDDLYITARGIGIIRYNMVKETTFIFDMEYTNIVLIDVFDNVIFGTNSVGGAFMIEDGKPLYFSELNGLHGNKCTAIFRDVEGNIWIGKDGNGLLKFSGTNVVSFIAKDGLSSEIVLSIVQNKNGDYAFGTYKDGITQMTGPEKTMRIKTSDDKLLDNTVWNMSTDAQGRTWIGTSRGLNLMDQDGNIIDQNYMTDSRKLRSIIVLNDSTMAMGGDSGLTIVTPDSSYSVFEDLNINQLQLVDDVLYCAAEDGLYTFDCSFGFDAYTKVNLPETVVNALTTDRRGFLWIGTMNGLFVMNKRYQIYRFPLDRLDYRSNSIVGLINSKRNRIWISTIKGIFEVIEDPNVQQGYRIYNYGDSEGIVDEECNINALYEDNEENIWIGTASGLVRIDPSSDSVLFSYEKPNLHITGIRLFMENFNYEDYGVEMDSVFGVPTSLILPYNRNHLTFDFIGINLKDPESVKYEHRLIGASDRWSPISTTTTATYSFLPAGEYEFQVRAMNKSRDWSEIRTIQITINAPFWKTWWFVSLCILLGILIVYLLFQSRISALKQRQDNEKLDMKNRLLFLEQRSLNASMNRHFIFNSLNSIQYFINSSDKLSANKFLSNFAKLIRKNLDSSASTNFIVTLQEEIERIELYLALEKMRFSDKFDYKVNVSSSLDTESIEIPSMILQPFVENSIIHGVLALPYTGEIVIDIYEELGEVIFIVRDNGVGIDQSLATKKYAGEGDHESKGVEITNRRIELLRKLTGENLLIIGPFQMNDAEGNVLGTKVILKLGGANKFE